MEGIGRQGEGDDVQLGAGVNGQLGKIISVQLDIGISTYVSAGSGQLFVADSVLIGVENGEPLDAMQLGTIIGKQDKDSGELKSEGAEQLYFEYDGLLDAALLLASDAEDVEQLRTGEDRQLYEGDAEQLDSEDEGLLGIDFGRRCTGDAKLSVFENSKVSGSFLIKLQSSNFVSSSFVNMTLEELCTKS